MRPNDADCGGRGVTIMGALPSQLQTLWPGAKNVPATLRSVFCWAERCDVEFGELWKSRGLKMADLLIASEYWLTFASCHLQVARGSDGRAAHAMRVLDRPSVMLLDDRLEPLQDSLEQEVSGLIGIAG